jgi:hypothetical protein
MAPSTKPQTERQHDAGHESDDHTSDEQTEGGADRLGDQLNQQAAQDGRGRMQPAGRGVGHGGRDDGTDADSRDGDQDRITRRYRQGPPKVRAILRCDATPDQHDSAERQ